MSLDSLYARYGHVLRQFVKFGMVGGAGVTTRDVGNLTTVETSRVVGGLPADVYVLTGQKITVTNTTEIAGHTVYLFLEKQE